MLTQFCPTVFPTEVDCGWRWDDSPLAPGVLPETVGATNGTIAPLQTGVESRQQDFFDPRLRRPKAYLWIERSCFEIGRGDSIRIVSVSAVATLKLVPPPVILVDKPAH